MNLRQETLRLLEKYDIQAKKRYGQNFLVDPTVAQRMAASSDLKAGQDVIEIGPGLGALTEELLKYPVHLTCYEVDEVMVRVLNDRFPQLKVSHEDFLKADLRAFKNFGVVASVPYNITSAILEKLLLCEQMVNMVLLVQKDVAYKFTRNFSPSPLTILAHVSADCEILFEVGTDAFIPAPRVGSAVLMMKRKSFLPESFYEFLKTAFKSRRKTLVNNLLPFDCTIWLDHHHYPHDVRAEKIKSEDWLSLYQERMSCREDTGLREN